MPWRPLLPITAFVHPRCLDLNPSVRILSASTLDIMSQQPSNSMMTDPFCLYDCSWTLYSQIWRAPLKCQALSGLGSSGRTARQNLARQLKNKFQRPPDDAEDEDAQKKSGVLQECSCELIGMSDDARGIATGLLISMTCEKAIHKFVLYGSGPSNSDGGQRSTSNILSLFMAKAPAHLVKRMVLFMVDTFDVSIQPLKLASPLLQSQLQNYIEGLTGHSSGPSASAPSSLIESVVQDLKVSVTFSTPIAPSLRSVDIALPSASALTMIQSATSGKASLLDLLAQHLNHQTGLQLPMASGTTSTGKSMKLK